LKKCAYCGSTYPEMTKDHVIPDCLYPKSKRTSELQLITVPACSRCNGSFSADETHFRSVMTLSGEINKPVRELWDTKVIPGFREIDGNKQLADLFEIIRAVQTKEGERWMVFPGEDERVLRVVRKVIRGLCHYHKILSPVPDNT